jgi:hypothetical protein
MGNIFINVNSNVPPPVWNRSQHAQKYLVLDMASQPAETSQYSNTSTHSYSPASPATLAYPSIQALTASMTALMPQSLPVYSTTLANPYDLPQMVTLFLDLYYKRHEMAKDPLTPGNEHPGWRALLPRWLGHSPVLDSAIGALAASFVGMKYQDESLVNKGRDMYLKALQMVQQALPEPSSTRWDLLATTLVMSSTELFLGNGGGPSQLTHIEGATRLLHNSIGQVGSEELYTYILNQGLWEALCTRRPYVFSLPAYRPLVRQIFSAPRTSRNHAFFQWSEIIVPLPNILNAIDTLASSATNASASTSRTPAALSILQDIAMLEQVIAPWYERLKATTAGPWAVPASQIIPDSVPFPLKFVSIEACTLYCLHWTSQLLILEARRTLYSHLSHSQLPQYSDHNTMLAQMTEYASLICRSVQFCTQGASYAATENMFLPLFTVASYYMRQGDEERKQWCLGAFTKIAVEQKIGFAAEMLDLVERRIVVQEAFTF